MRRKRNVILPAIGIALAASFIVELLVHHSRQLPKQQIQVTHNPKILGFYTQYNEYDDTSLRSFEQFSGDINSVATMTFALNATGGVVGTTPSEVLSIAQEGNVQVYAGITNINHDNFDGALLHNVLSNSSREERVLQNVVNTLEDNHCNGLVVDFENVFPRDRTSLTNFLRKLSSRLHQRGLQLQVCVPAKASDSPQDAWSGAYNYSAIGQVADEVDLMTYDEHGTWGPPGPVASQVWLHSVLNYATSAIPRNKVLMGIASYGYDWDLSNKKKSRALAWTQVTHLLSRTKAKVLWSQLDAAPYFKYKDSAGDSHIVWYENVKSVADKVQLADHSGLAGIAMWRLGLEDAAFWDAVKTGIEHS